jgi:hypothetical protein
MENESDDNFDTESTKDRGNEFIPDDKGCERGTDTVPQVEQSTLDHKTCIEKKREVCVPASDSVCADPDRSLESECESDSESESSWPKPPNHIRDPFVDRPAQVKDTMTRLSKRTQRYRSTASSRIDGMTVGDIRYCFQQLRNAGDDLSSDMILYNGRSAGAFALAYLTETSNAMRKRRKLKKTEEEEQQATKIVKVIPAKESTNQHESSNILTF